MLLRLTLTTLLALATASGAAAQWATPPGGDVRHAQALSVSLSAVSFQHDRPPQGEQSPLVYEGPLVGLHLTSQNNALAVYYGNRPTEEAGGANFLDVSGMLWGRWSPIEALSEGSTRAFLPIALFANYRRVQSPESSDVDNDQVIRSLEFDAFAFGLGAGLGAEQQVGRQFLVRGRAIPVVGFSERSTFGGTFFSDPTYLLDAGLEVVLGDLYHGMGLSLGYGYRAQVWRMSPIASTDEETTVYDGTHHHVRLGLTW